MKRILTVLVFSFCFSSLFSQRMYEKDFGFLRLEFPADWAEKGVLESDSNVFYFIAAGDTVCYDTTYRRNWFRPYELTELDTLGEYNIPEGIDSSFYQLLEEANKKKGANNAIIRDKNQHWRRTNELLRETYPFSYNHHFENDTIQEYVLTRITPANNKGNTTGVYIEMIDQSGFIYIRGRNLSDHNKEEIIRIPETINFGE